MFRTIRITMKLEGISLDLGLKVGVVVIDLAWLYIRNGAIEIRSQLINNRESCIGFRIILKVN